MSQFRNLVFEGGGVKGLAYAGALEMLEQDNILPDIRRVAGTSAGAITATVLALGATSKDITEILKHANLQKFMDDTPGFIRDTKRLLIDYGWYRGDAFEKWMRGIIFRFTSESDLTFQKLRELIQRYPGQYRDLYVVGTNLSTQQPEVYSAETTPDMPIYRAIRISMSIPLFFAAITLNHKVYVDGGITWNYPINLFDDRKYIDQGARGFVVVSYPTIPTDTYVYNKETLGFRVDTEDEIKAKLEQSQSPTKIDNIVDYIQVLLKFIMDMLNKTHLHQNDWHRTVFIDVEGTRTTDFDLSEDKIQMLIENGRKAVRAYFTWFNDPNETPINRI